MSWLYVPPETLPEQQTHACTVCPSAPEPEGSTSASPLSAPLIALYVTSSAKPTLRPPSWRGWKTRPWIRHLSGTTLPPLTAAHGVERWILSLADIRASHSRSRASARGSTIPGICGRTSRASSRNANPNGCFWKTSPIISTSAIARSEASWKSWASGLRKDCLRRQKLARRTNASDCLFWPTPNVAGGGNPPGNLTAKGNHFIRPSGKKAHLGLDQVAKMWSHHPLWSHHSQWPTPHANCMTGPGNAGRAGGMNLQTSAALWPTPMASDGCKPSAGNRKSADLTHASRMWPTPAARDAKGANSREHVEVNGTGRRHMDQLANFAVHSLPARTITRDGSDTCDQRRVLNPAFVEALMGWPVGWTDFGSGQRRGPVGCSACVSNSVGSVHCRWMMGWRNETIPRHVADRGGRQCDRRLWRRRHHANIGASMV